MLWNVLRSVWLFGGGIRLPRTEYRMAKAAEFFLTVYGLPTRESSYKAVDITKDEVRTATGRQDLKTARGQPFTEPLPSQGSPARILGAPSVIMTRAQGSPGASGRILPKNSDPH